MARFTETELERLKTDISVERLIETAGIVLRKSGKDKVGLCPFHDDHEPSMRVTSATNLWHCPACGAGGDVIAWVMKLRGISFRHAVEILKTQDVGLQTSGQIIKRASVKKLIRASGIGCRRQSLIETNGGLLPRDFTAIA